MDLLHVHRNQINSFQNYGANQEVQHQHIQRAVRIGIDDLR